MAELANVDWNDPASVFGALGGGAGTSLPIPKMITPQEVRSKATERSTAIFADWELLKAILERHEATIHKRWLKKTKNQCAEILLKAWPGMVSSSLS